MKTVIPAQAGIQETMPNRGAISGPRPAPGRQMPSNRANPFEIGRRARIVFAGPFTLWAGNENRHSGAGRNPGNDAESGGHFWTPACAGATDAEQSCKSL
jgi:hypothetical protein